MGAVTTIRANGKTEVSACATLGKRTVLLSILNAGGGDLWAWATLTAPQVDELIRALAAARVEISNARPL